MAVLANSDLVQYVAVILYHWLYINFINCITYNCKSLNVLISILYVADCFYDKIINNSTYITIFYS